MTKNSSKNRSGNQVWNLFTSVKLTVVLLLLLAATSIIGTLVPQNGTEPFYIQKYGELLFKFLNALDLFDMYSAWWFMLLLLLLSINIIVCSIDKLDTTWKIIFPDKVTFNIERFRRLKHKETFETSHQLELLEAKYLSFIEKAFATAVKERGENGVAIFGERGRWSRLGVYVVHLSILFMLSGAVIGTVWGFKAFVAIPEGDTVDSAFLRDNETPVKLGFKIRCNAFSVSFHDTGQPEEFKSNLTVIEDGKESFTKDVLVNAPLRYRGLSFYQSSYGIDSAKSVVFKITSRDSGMTYSQKMDFGQTVDVPESGGKFTLNEFVRGYNFRGHNLGEGFVGRFSTNGGSDKNKGEIEIYIPVKFPTFDKMRRGAFAFEIQDYEKKYYTGLQVTKDPGVWWVYVGFILMIIGCWITFFISHQSICVEIRPKVTTCCGAECDSAFASCSDSGVGSGCCSKASDDAVNIYEVVVSGTANRNSQGMRLKIAKIASKIKGL